MATRFYRALRGDDPQNLGAFLWLDFSVSVEARQHRRWIQQRWQIANAWAQW